VLAAPFHELHGTERGGDPEPVDLLGLLQGLPGKFPGLDPLGKPRLALGDEVGDNPGMMGRRPWAALLLLPAGPRHGAVELVVRPVALLFQNGVVGPVEGTARPVTSQPEEPTTRKRGLLAVGAYILQPISLRSALAYFLRLVARAITPPPSGERTGVGGRTRWRQAQCRRERRQPRSDSRAPRPLRAQPRRRRQGPL
jgi:hypothetical protein